MGEGGGPREQAGVGDAAGLHAGDRVDGQVLDPGGSARPVEWVREGVPVVEGSSAARSLKATHHPGPPLAQNLKAAN